MAVYNIFHDTPKIERNLIMLPVGVYYNRDIHGASVGDKIRFIDGNERTIVGKSDIDLRMSSTDLICRYIYNCSMKIVFRKWLTNAVIEGNGRNVVSKNKCMLIWYK